MQNRIDAAWFCPITRCTGCCRSTYQRRKKGSLTSKTVPGRTLAKLDADSECKDGKISLSKQRKMLIHPHESPLPSMCKMNSSICALVDLPPPRHLPFFPPISHCLLSLPPVDPCLGFWFSVWIQSMKVVFLRDVVCSWYMIASNTAGLPDCLPICYLASYGPCHLPFTSNLRTSLGLGSCHSKSVCLALDMLGGWVPQDMKSSVRAATRL